MASILNSKAKFYQRAPQSGEEAKHTIESEADIFIKALSRKQLDTKISLEQQLGYEKEFHLRHVYQPETSAGVTSIENFEDLSGIEEINPDQGGANDGGDLIDSRISRHARELALAIKPNSVETKLLKFAISCNALGRVQTDTRPADHPINTLHEIEQERFGYISNGANPLRLAKTYLRKRRQMVTDYDEPLVVKPKPVLPKGKSLWDVNEASTIPPKPRGRLYTCAKQKSFTITDGHTISETNANGLAEKKFVDAECIDETEANSIRKLSETEIKELPKFSDYDKGNPSEILYVKNLASSVLETDLAFLFAKYQEPGKPRITFTLMKKGRMRGQAFINCHSVETAELILEEVNGVFLNGKPIIIQFSSKRQKNG